jgi:Cysteine rich repeat
MKRALMWITVPCLALVLGGCAPARYPLVEQVAKGCDQEITTYCKEVTPGEGRVLACLYAHEDKLSGQCEYALYDAVAQLERALTALTYVANECRDDMMSYCADINPGEGRLLSCLDKNSAKINKRCTQAMKDTGLK